MFGFRHAAVVIRVVVVAVFVVLSGVAVGIAPAAAATVVSEVWVTAGRVLDVELSSPSIDGTGVKWVRMFVPPGWTNSTGTYPTLWMLHGGLDDHKSWGDNTDLNQLTANKNVIVVMPETSWCSAYSDWYNTGTGGAPKWETYLLNELDPILRSRYKANTVRAVGGNSMGGIGSMVLPARHPGFFRAAAAFSGNLDPLHAKSGNPNSPDLPGQSCLLTDWRHVWGDYTIAAQRPIWVAHDAVLQAANLRNIPLFLSAGNNSSDTVEQDFLAEVQAMVAAMSGSSGLTADVPEATNSVCNGGHNWACWNQELKRALPLLLPSIGVPYP